ncbi:MAG: hypothetical protein QM690_04345 [Sphingobium sp.]
MVTAHPHRMLQNNYGEGEKGATRDGTTPRAWSDFEPEGFIRRLGNHGKQKDSGPVTVQAEP